jgi:hypothetical protein
MSGPMTSSRTEVPHARSDRRVHPRVPGDPGRSQAELHRRHRRPVGPAHPPRHPWPHPLRPWPGVHCQGRTGMDRGRGARTAFIEPGSPWENGYCESFNSKLRDELLNGEIFYSLTEARTVIEAWRRHYNTRRPHSSLGYRPPAPQAVQWPAPPTGSAAPATPAVAPRHVMN